MLDLAFELGGNSGKLAFTIGAGQAPGLRSLPARSLVGLGLEIQKAKDIGRGFTDVYRPDDGASSEITRPQIDDLPRPSDGSPRSTAYFSRMNPS